MSTQSRKTLGSWLAPPRFILFCLLLVGASGGMIALHQTAVHSVMLGFDVAALAFLLSLLPVLKAGNAESMRRNAAENDANRVMLLIITGAVTAVILVVVASELGGEAEGGAKALILATLALAWLFSNVIYALHYAHLWYSRSEQRRDSGGIDFPGTDEPDYWDFIYFAFTLGMTFQTSDINITGQRVRRLVTAHCFAAFVFNLGILAFTINVLGSGGKG